MHLIGGRFFQFLKVKKNLRPIKRILAIPTSGKICVVSEPQPSTFEIFQTEHPVVQKERLQIDLYSKLADNTFVTLVIATSKIELIPVFPTLF